ncbi:MAG: PAS domain-containing sensor histidine kinase [Boseongicola sp. SB0677_bin_26]|nr:PAS domain-containing sensor histidine kinase [Boseongicola sp. SB0665_bin_10]MYG27234.1 PAS domain-containing sensor histidine kinase [Boseongicola sp. SB0677_bin_26]
MTKIQDGLWMSIPVPAILLDGNDRIVGMNPAAESYLNSSARQSAGLSAFDALATDAPMSEHAARVRREQAPLFMNNMNVVTGGNAAERCDIKLAPMIGTSDHLVMLVEPRFVRERLNQALSGSSAARSAIGMAEMLAHEIKNPLAGITGAAQLLGMNLVKDDLALTDLIVSETRRILALLEQVEQFGNMRPPVCRAVNVHDLIVRARRSASVGFAAHMEFVDEFDPSLPMVWVDEGQILQVFSNLLKNAAEATGGSPGRIRIRTFYDMASKIRRNGRTDGLVLNVEIVDDGPGIPSSILQGIFDPFVSGRENGTGLGLALASRIVSDHDGWITVESVPGSTAFRLSLPAAPKDQQQ